MVNDIPALAMRLFCPDLSSSILLPLLLLRIGEPKYLTIASLAV